MKNEMVYQANYLINHRQNMSRDENRFFLSLVSMIGKKDEKLTYNVPVSVFAETWNIDRPAMYRKVKDVLESLRRKGIQIETVEKSGKRRCFGCGFISDYEYVEGAARAEVSISPKFKPYLLELKKAYTGYQLEQVVKLDAAGAGYSTIRIYEVCSQWLYKGEFSYTVEHFKQVLDIVGKYPRMYDLKKYVLTAAVGLINEETDLTVDYEIKGRGTAASIFFTVTRKKNSAVDVPEIVEEPEPEPAADPLEEPAPETTPENVLSPRAAALLQEEQETVEAVAYKLEKLEKGGVTFTDEEIVVCINHARSNGCRDILDVVEYFQFNVDYILSVWHTIRNKKTYCKACFKQNYGAWEPA